jgi:hypothetical protein
MTGNGQVAPDMITLLLMPIMIELITRGAILENVMKGGVLTLRSVLADGEMSALSWIPSAIVLVWEWITRPIPLPPEKYVPRKHRKRTGSWLWKIIPDPWIKRARSLMESQAVTRLGPRGTS